MMTEREHMRRRTGAQAPDCSCYIQGEDIRDVHAIFRAAEYAKNHFAKQLRKAARKHNHRDKASIDDFCRRRLVSWFRGHAGATWKLTPSVLRQHYNEKTLLQGFMRKAPSRVGKCPDGNDAAGWISVMQHHGLPTRLLDWTHSILVAAFFAVGYEEKKGDAALWALCPTLLNHAYRNDPSFFLLAGPATQPILACAFGLASGPLQDEILAVLPPEADLRLLLQQSAFTLHASTAALEQSRNPGSYLIKFRIPAKAKTGLAEQLKTLGFCRSSLFPDLERLADDVANRPPKKAQ